MTGKKQSWENTANCAADVCRRGVPMHRSGCAGTRQLVMSLSSSAHPLYYNGSRRLNELTSPWVLRYRPGPSFAPYLSWSRQTLHRLPLRMSQISKRTPKMMLLEQRSVPHFLAGRMGALLASEGPTCRSDDCLVSSRVSSYLPIHRRQKGASRMPITSRK